MSQIMEAPTVHNLQCPTWIDLKKIEGKSIGSLRFSQPLREQKRFWILSSAHLQPDKTSKSVSSGVSCSDKNFPGSLLETGSFQAPFNEGIILKNKSQEIKPYLEGLPIYLVGMMGSGKTTVGKLMSRELGYTFFDSDSLIEQAMNGASVAEIFELYGENFFRAKETEALKRLSFMHQVVVSTGGGVVVRPINWKYMHEGISVWLDVPLEALAQRITEVGTNSRPLLHHESGDAYTAAFKRLSTIWEERGEAYTNANARVSLEYIAAKFGHEDVSGLTPTAIAIEAFEQIKIFLRGKDGKDAQDAQGF